MQALEKKIEIPSADRSSNIVTTWPGEALRRILLFPALRPFAPVKVEGIERLNGEGPYIFAANHSSHLDTPLLLEALPMHLRLRVRVAAASDYFFTGRWKGAFVGIMLNAFAFERKGPGCAKSLAHAKQLLNAGYSLIIFPEGTRTTNGQLQPFKWGVGKLALVGPVQIIPTWIDGTYTVLPKGARWPRRHKVTIRFGHSISFSGKRDPVSIAAEIEQQVRALALEPMSL